MPTNQLIAALRSLGFLTGKQSWILGTLLGRMDSGVPMHEPERDELEGRLQATMLIYFDDQYKRLAELMKDGVADPNWDYEQQLAAEFMLPDITATHQLGALAGGLAVSGVGIDWGLVNESAVGWARTHTLSVSGQITETTRKRYALVRDEVAEDIAAWIEEGEPLPRLIRTLEAKMPAHRAEMVAVTEVTRAYAEANTNAWEMSGEVEGRRWRTAQDEHVCEICGKVDAPGTGLFGQVAKMGEPFIHPTTGLKYDNPPAHVRCRCGVTPEIIRLPGEVAEEYAEERAEEIGDEGHA